MPIHLLKSKPALERKASEPGVHWNAAAASGFVAEEPEELETKVQQLNGCAR